RIDSPNPLVWDLVFFIGFGVIPLVIGAMLPRGGPPRRPERVVAASMALLTMATLTAGAWALRAPPDQPFTTVVFRHDFGPPEVMAALASVDARLVWADAAMGVVVVDLAYDDPWRRYTEGALLVSG